MGLGSEHGALDFYSDLRMRLTKNTTRLATEFSSLAISSDSLSIAVSVSSYGYWRLASDPT